MKKLLGYLIFFGIIIACLYIYLDYKAQKKAEQAELEQRKREIEELRKIEDQERHALAQEDMERQQRLMENRKQREELVSKRRGTQSLAIPTPLPIQSAPQGYKHKAKVDAACRESRCTLVQYKESGDSSYILVQGPDHSAVSAVLDPLVRAGMRDFTEHKEQFKAETIQGRRVYSAAYTIKW